jgi:hypothetical protein
MEQYTLPNKSVSSDTAIKPVARIPPTLINFNTEGVNCKYNKPFRNPLEKVLEKSINANTKRVK